jgi:serine/threonine protein kinase
VTEAHLTVEEGPAAGSVFVVREGTPVVLGRGPGAELVLRDPAVAPRHLGLLVQQGALAVHDLAGGARLNDAPLAPRVATPARAGDLVGVGRSGLRVDLVGGRRQRSTARLSDPGVPAADFELEGEIGRGASGKVFAARRRSDGRRVAIKLLVERVATADEARRFEREGQTLARLKSPHVVELLERRVHEGRALLVMELVEGPSARDLVQAGPLPLGKALSIAADVARAVAAAAQVGIVHRDIKPGNVLVGPDGRARLCDFGVAKDLDALRTTLTRTGQGLGTMAYLPPEQVAQARDVDSLADVYSLGATLYHLLAGRPPFEPTTAESLQRILVDPPPPLLALRPDCPPEVAALVTAMLSKEPEGRPAPWSLPDTLEALRRRYAP